MTCSFKPERTCWRSFKDSEKKAEVGNDKFPAGWWEPKEVVAGEDSEEQFERVEETKRVAKGKGKCGRRAAKTERSGGAGRRRSG